MLEWISSNTEWIFSGVGVAIITAVAGLFWRRRPHANRQDTHGGGPGGNAEVLGDGEARGGKGGTSGPFGPGGKGGDARVKGSGKAVGGAGGNGE